jgi:hypothetical protein
MGPLAGDPVHEVSAAEAAMFIVLKDESDRRPRTLGRTDDHAAATLADNRQSTSSQQRKHVGLRQSAGTHYDVQ